MRRSSRLIRHLYETLERREWTTLVGDELQVAAQLGQRDAVGAERAHQLQHGGVVGEGVVELGRKEARNHLLEQPDGAHGSAVVLRGVDQQQDLLENKVGGRRVELALRDGRDAGRERRRRAGRQQVPASDGATQQLHQHDDELGARERQ